ncbi:hypothetical protein GJ496_009672 [Pomphorhynchus laevis]|nr:hypothetical protein GJ496_009672 [Pomphorhynchus laevis]
MLIDKDIVDDNRANRLHTNIRMTNRPVNVSCPLLDFEENKILFQMLGNDRYTLATSVVQVLLSHPPSHTKWAHYCTGVACFVKDYIMRSYFFRVYSITSGLLWEHEFYRGFEYNVVTPIFHCFEASESMAAFSFAEANDALRFGHAVVGKIHDKKAKLNRRKERQQKTVMEESTKLSYEIDNSQAVTIQFSTNNGYTNDKKYSEPFADNIDYASSQRRSSSPVVNGIRHYSSIQGRQNIRRRKISKSEISNPISCTFEHREHIGIDGVSTSFI